MNPELFDRYPSCHNSDMYRPIGHLGFMSSVKVKYSGGEVVIDDVDIDTVVSDFISNFCTDHNLPGGDYYLVYRGTNAGEDCTLAEIGVKGRGETLELHSKNIPA